MTQLSRIHYNNGTDTPFMDVTGAFVISDLRNVLGVVLVDLDHDEDLDLVSSIHGLPNTLHLNANSGLSFSTSHPSFVAIESHNTAAMIAEDFNGDSLVDIIAGNLNQRDRYYTRNWRTSPARATSLEIDTESDYLTAATLTAESDLPPNTGIDYFLSNNGGQRWFKVRPGIEFPFPTFGSDLRWRAELHSLSPILTPELDSLTITASVGLDAKTTWRTMHWTIGELENPTLESTVWGDAANPDGDLHNNRFEYIAGTTPTDEASDFSLTIAPVPGQATQRQIIFSPLLPDRTYRVLSRPDLASPTLAPLGSSTVSDDAQTRAVTDTDADAPARFYRVEITLP